MKSRKGMEQKAKQNKKKYIAGLLALCVLITAALTAPRVIFKIQDMLLCRENVLQAQEAMDVTALSMNYERSLYQRMRKFAEGLARKDKFYVDERELEVTEEVTFILFSAEGLLQDSLLLLRDAGMLSEELLLNSSIQQYKQYVVYNDNYARGVNFILWFFDLQTSKGERMYLLMDAQDYTIYALRTFGSELTYREADYYYNFLDFWYNPNIVWFLFCDYYGVFEMEDIEKLFDKYKESSAIDILIIVNEVAMQLDAEGAAAGYYQSKEEELRLLLPYQGSVLNFEIYLLGSIVDGAYKNGVLFPDVEIGVYELYQLIPEFRSNG